MLKKQTAFCTFLILISQFVYPNAKPLPGYYLDLKGDTVHCDIEYKNWATNSGTIQVQVNNGLKEFTTEEIKGFGVYGYGDYISSKVTYHTNPISGEDLPKNFTDNTETKVYFLKVLKKNVYSLYSLTLPTRCYFFISYPGKQFVELLYRAKRINDSLVEDLSFRNQMLALLANEGLSQRYFEQVSELSYTGPSVGDLIDILNEAITGVETKRQPGNLEFDVFAGIIQNSFPTSFNMHYATDCQFSSQISPTFGANFLYHFRGGKFMLGLSEGYNGYHLQINKSGSFQTDNSTVSSTSVYNETASTDNVYLVSNFYIMYMVNPLDQTRFYAKAGINYYFSLVYLDNRVNTTWTGTETGVMKPSFPFQNDLSGSDVLMTMKSNIIAFKAAVGVNFGRSFLELSYSPPAPFATMNPGINSGDNPSDITISNLGLCYYYKLFQ